MEITWNPAVGPELLLIKAIYLPLLIKNTTGFTAKSNTQKERAQKEAKSTQSWIRPKTMMRCFKSVFKDKSPVYTCVSRSVFWTNWLLLTLTEYPWPSVWVPVTKKYWASNGPCFHNRLSNTAFDYKVRNAGRYNIVDNGHDSREAMGAHCALMNVLIRSRKTRSDLRRRLLTAVPEPSPVSFPILPPKRIWRLEASTTILWCKWPQSTSQGLPTLRKPFGGEVEYLQEKKTPPYFCTDSAKIQ